jgi:magnesium transporter
MVDIRDQGPLQARRQSIAQGGTTGRFGSQLSVRNSTHRASMYSTGPQSRSRLHRTQNASDSEEDGSTDRAPLLGRSYRSKTDPPRGMPSGSYGGISGSPSALRHDPFYDRRQSKNSSRSSHRRIDQFQRPRSPDNDYDINNPPSVPTSPKFGPEMGYDDVMLTEADINRGRASDRGDSSRDALIDIDNNKPIDRVAGAASPSPGALHRRMTLNPAEDDVCFPHEALTEVGESVIGEEDKQDYARPRRRGRRIWPDLGILQDWASEEKEQRTTERIRARKVSEPLMVGGRLRPQKFAWHRTEEEEPMRFTYFNEDFQSTLHSQSMSELPQDHQTFRDLFIPDPPVLSDSDSDDDDADPFLPHDNGNTRDNASIRKASMLSPGPLGRTSRADFDRGSSRAPSDRKPEASKTNSSENTGENTPILKSANEPEQCPKRYGTRPIWWLDVLSPTDAEMKLLSKSFGIHPLTAEDVMMQEQREKVELFRNYYFVNYRTFEQDTNSEDYMEPINMYVVVFREGVISFHFSQTPHPANVRRRIRQLKDYLILTTDWISYAIIDDITDAYAPLIQRIEEEVDVIDEAILTLHAQEESAKSESKYKKTVQRYLDYPGEKESESGETAIEAGDMLRRVGECRKKVMSLYRLLGNKADVIKGFAKRCNEQWEIAPKSEIGLYLGDIQDHIVTMTGNLSHYEKFVYLPP